MFDNLQNTQIAVSSEEDLLAAAGEEKPEDKTKGAGGKTKDEKITDKTKGKEKPEDKTKDKSKGNTDTKKTVTALSKKDLELAAGSDDDDDDDNADDDIEDDDTDDDNSDVKDKTKKNKKEKPVAGDNDDKTDDNNDDDTQDDDDENAEDDEDTDDDENTGGNIEIKDFLKARVDLLIKKGEWFEFEGREDVEWDEENFAEVEIKQQEAKKAELREELLDSFGPYGREIADYTAKGGDPETLIDIFKEQQRVENLSIESEDQQKAVVLKYVTEFQNMKPKQAQTYINALIADKELADTAKEAKESMEADLKAQEKALKDEQDDAIGKREAKTKSDLQRFANDVSGVLNTRTDITPDEKKELIKVLTKFDRKLQNGTPVNDFYFKFAEFKKNLPNYIELVRFVLDPKKYVKTAENKGKTTATEKAFNLVRTSNTSKKSKSSQPGSSKSDKKTTFKLLY